MRELVAFLPLILSFFMNYEADKECELKYCAVFLFYLSVLFAILKKVLKFAPAYTDKALNIDLYLTSTFPITIGSFLR